MKYKFKLPSSYHEFSYLKKIMIQKKCVFSFDRIYLLLWKDNYNNLV